MLKKVGKTTKLRPRPRGDHGELRFSSPGVRGAARCKWFTISDGPGKAAIVLATQKDLVMVGSGNRRCWINFGGKQAAGRLSIWMRKID